MNQEQELPLEFRASQGESLKAVLHLPAGEGPFPALLCFHGLTLNMGQFTVLGRRLAGRGLALLRFDAIGHGASQGSLLDLRLDRLAGDGFKAWTFLAGLPQVDPARTGLLGFSMGACVACLTAERIGPALGALVLWAPLLNTREWADKRLSEFKTPQPGRVEVWGGKVVAQELFDSAAGFPCLELAARLPAPLFLSHPGRDFNMPPAYSRQIAALRQARGLETETFWPQQSAHLFEVPAEREELLGKTADFLVRTLVNQGRS